MSEKLDKAALFQKIWDSEKVYLGDRYPEYGKLVIRGAAVGAPYDFDNAIGYIVQIREKRGAYGSQMYLVRHASGELFTHENMSFWLLNEEDQDAAMSFFKVKPDQEGGDTEYSILSNEPKVGYIIPFEDGAPTSEFQNYSMAITTTLNR